MDGFLRFDFLDIIRFYIRQRLCKDFELLVDPTLGWQPFGHHCSSKHAHQYCCKQHQHDLLFPYYFPHGRSPLQLLQTDVDWCLNQSSRPCRLLCMAHRTTQSPRRSAPTLYSPALTIHNARMIPPRQHRYAYKRD